MLLLKRFHSRGIDFLAEKMVTSLERVFTKENSYVGLERHC